MTVESAALIGYQERIEWRGKEILTLAEVWPTEVRAVIVGINPSLTSVDAGHYFQGKGARGQVLRLVRVGLLTPDTGERVFERAALEAGVGIADLVRRPTPSAKTVSPAERAYGRAHFEANLAARNVPLIIGIYAPPIAELMQGKSHAGFQEKRTSWGARIFRMPGPYDKPDRVAETMAQLKLELART